MKRVCEFSEDRKYRYTLFRRWADGPLVTFVALNPSTADEVADDPTNRRIMNFARSWGFGAVQTLNIFAFRATDPKEMMREEDPIGKDNDDFLRVWAQKSDMVICSWGVHGEHRGRGAQVLRLLENVPLHHLGLTKNGHPRHPLYLPSSAQPVHWRFTVYLD